MREQEYARIIKQNHIPGGVSSPKNADRVISSFNGEVQEISAPL
jgi:hypothetical protein